MKYVYIDIYNKLIIYLYIRIIRLELMIWRLAVAQPWFMPCDQWPPKQASMPVPPPVTITDQNQNVKVMLKQHV